MGPSATSSNGPSKGMRAVTSSDVDDGGFATDEASKMVTRSTLSRVRAPCTDKMVAMATASRVVRAASLAISYEFGDGCVLCKQLLTIEDDGPERPKYKCLLFGGFPA